MNDLHTLPSTGYMHPNGELLTRNARLVKEIESSYQSHRGFKHPFWDWFQTGDYSLTCLKDFALMYWEHVKLFRLYLAGAMTIMPTERLQMVLAEIISDEFGLKQGDVSHPEMFRNFMRSLDLSERDWRQNRLIAGVDYFRHVHYSMFHNESIEETLGAVIFGFEMSTTYRHQKIAEGLSRFGERHGRVIDARFFEGHVEIDSDHASRLIGAMVEALPSLSLERIKRGARISFNAREMFLDDLGRHLAVPFDTAGSLNAWKYVTMHDLAY